MKITVVDVDSQSRGVCYQKVLDLVNNHKLPFTVSSSSPEALEREKEVQVVILGQSIIRKFSSQINVLKRAHPKAIFIAFTPEYRLSVGFVEKLALLGVDEVFDSETSEYEIKKRLIFVLHRVRQSNGYGGLVTLIGSKGNSGVTSLVSALGESFTNKNFSTCLIDSDFEYQNLSRFLMCKQPASIELADILLMNRGLSFETLLSSIYELNSTGSLGLLTPPNLGFDEMLTKDKISQNYLDCLGLLSNKFDVLILDLPFHAPSKFKELIISNSDTIIFVVTPEATSLLNFINILQKFKTKLMHSTRIGIVVNFHFDGGIPIKLIKSEAENIIDSVNFLEKISACSKAKFWAGSSKTFYGSASSRLKQEIDKISSQLKETLNLPERAAEALTGSTTLALNSGLNNN